MHILNSHSRKIKCFIIVYILYIHNNKCTSKKIKILLYSNLNLLNNQLILILFSFFSVNKPFSINIYILKNKYFTL